MPRIVCSYKYLLLILSLSLAISLVRGQGSNGPVIINDSVMMIGPDVESLTEEQIYFNPTYLVVDPTKGHLRDQLIRACVCDCDTSVPNRRIGIFSVAKGKKVSFSQGSLQYLPAANLWKFADAQYEYLHNSNKYNSPIYRNWVDLFDWRGVAGVSFDDWGKNAICGDTSQTWRTLSADEWKYLLHDRKHATELLLPAMVENTLGLVVLPDDWVCPEGVTLVTLSQTDVTWDEAQRVYTYSSNIYLSNVFSLTSWQRMEEAGAVFMPASGYINKDGVLNACGTVGRYWSSSPNKNINGYYMSFGIAPNSATNSIRTQSDVNADKGHTVRLVHDTIMPLPLPCETFEVKGVTFNMMCVEGETYDYLIGETEVTRALWKAVMGNLPNSYTASNAPIDNVSWGECQQFIQKLNQLTGQHFRFPTKAEWLYAAKGGKNNEGFLYSGSDNIDEVGWYSGNSVGGGQPVATLKPNDLGIYDMTGNVWEWVAKTGKNNYPYMGGSYAFSAEKCLLSKASGVASEANHKGSIGLRLVLDKHTYVDLGLSVMWATTNVGAESAEEFGDYFAWGETEPKEVYDWSTYKWCDGTEDIMTKYNATDGLTTLLPEDDAAHVNWGGEWRMASDVEFQELIDNCLFEITNHNGVKGTWVTSKINGNRIFIPYAGYYNHGNGGTADKNYSSQQRLWTSSSIGRATHAKDYCNQAIEGNTRRCGFPIRPVVSAGRDIQIPPTPGKRIGVFSVAADKQVSFSQGNLQYTQSKNQWRFAEKQYDYLGADNVTDGALADKIDLFGWSANNSTAPFGISTSTNVTDYASDFVDWGTNIIQGDAANTWRTMSADEWEYLLEKRKNASNLYGVAKVAGENGLIILPDDWKAPEGIIFKAGLHSSQVDDFSVYQSFTADEWKVMEEAGAVFLHASGYRDGANVEKCNTSGYYWSNTTSNGDDAYRMYFYSYFLGPKDVHSKYRGRSVRLVHDTIVPPPAPCETFKVNGVTFNMMCVEGGTFVMGSDASSNEKPMHQVTIPDFLIGQTEVTQELWQVVMGNNPSHFKGAENPVEYVSWSDCQKFIANLNQLTGKKFRLPTEAEWEYAARGGQMSKDFVFSGSDNVDKVGWYTNNSGAMSHPVKQKLPNELGIYDMSGNVWEWCQDWYGDYSTDTPINPQGPSSGSVRVIRGGSWMNDANDCRVSRRLDLTPAARTSNLGLRLVLDKHEYVDLGLSVMWATTNVGAESAEEYGEYFAWGETEPKEAYSWDTYKWCNSADTSITKYNNADGMTTLLPEDDAATVNWGGKWRTPTKEELAELRLSCTWEWTTLNGINGHQVTGPNGNSIFIPAGGSYNQFNHEISGVGIQGWFYASDRGAARHANEIGTPAKGPYSGSCSRCCGLTIRPVCEKDSNIATVIIDPTPANSNVGLYSRYEGSVKVTRSIRVEKGNDVLYQVSNTENGYLSQGDTLYKVMRDTVLKVSLKPFTEGNWETVDLTGLTRYDNYYISRNRGIFAGPYSNWCYYVMPVNSGETYRVSSRAGQLAALWFIASTPPDYENKIPPTKVNCSKNGGIVGYIAEEFTVSGGVSG